jgi:hypothetical protein
MVSTARRDELRERVEGVARDVNALPKRPRV